MIFEWITKSLTNRERWQNHIFPSIPAMTRRASQQRLLSRLNSSGVIAPQSRPTEPPNTLQCSHQEPTWEELLGRR